MRALASSLSLALVLVVACDSDLPDRPDDTPIVGSDLGMPTSCQRPAEGCPCDSAAEPVDCYQTMGFEGGDRVCGAGIRSCIDGIWGACAVAEEFTLPGGGALIDGPTNCDVCSPLCWEGLDQPELADITAANSDNVVEGGGGATLPPSDSNVALPSDSDGDGVPDVADDCPGTAGLTGFFGCPDTGGTPGIFVELDYLTGSVTEVCPLLGQPTNSLDVYLVFSVKTSMNASLASLRAELTTGTLGTCPGGVLGEIECILPGSHFGVGSFGIYPDASLYGGAGYVLYNNLQDLNLDPGLSQVALDSITTRTSISWGTAGMNVLYSIATGDGLGTWLPPRAGCPAATFGYPCFRDGAIPVVIMVTDQYSYNGADPAAPLFDNAHLGFTTPTYTDATNALSAAGIQVINVQVTGSGAPNSAWLVTEQNSVQADTGSPAPIVVNSSGAGLGTAIVNTLQGLVDTTRVDITAHPQDDPATAGVDERDFVVSMTAVGDGPIGECDSFAGSVYTACLPGTDVTWNIELRNDIVMPTADAQVFDIPVEIHYDGAVHETKTVRVLVPAQNLGCSGPYSVGAINVGDCRFWTTRGIDADVAANGTLYLDGMALAYGMDWQRNDSSQVELLGAACADYLADTSQAVTGDFVCAAQVGTYWRIHDGYGGDTGGGDACVSPPERPFWTSLEFDVDTPADTSITFTFQPADTELATMVAPGASVTVPGTASPIDVTAVLQAAGLRDDLRFLRVSAQLTSSPDRLSAPVLRSMTQEWECLAIE